jgi:hypothetical protein
MLYGYKKDRIFLHEKMNKTCIKRFLGPDEITNAILFLFYLRVKQVE